MKRNTLFLALGFLLFYSCTELIEIPSLPSSQFSVSGDQCGAPCTVTFTNQTEGADSYNWDFGDGGTSSEENPSHEFQLPGTFEVTLKTSNASGEGAESKKLVDIAYKTFIHQELGGYTVSVLTTGIDDYLLFGRNLLEFGSILIGKVSRYGGNDYEWTKEINSELPQLGGDSYNIRQVIKNKKGEYIAVGTITVGFSFDAAMVIKINEDGEVLKSSVIAYDEVNFTSNRGESIVENDFGGYVVGIMNSDFINEKEVGTVIRINEDLEVEKEIQFLDGHRIESLLASGDKLFVSIQVQSDIQPTGAIYKISGFLDRSLEDPILQEGNFTGSPISITEGAGKAMIEVNQNIISVLPGYDNGNIDLSILNRDLETVYLGIVENTEHGTPSSLIKCSDGNIAFLISVVDWENDVYNISLIKMSSSGNELWRKTYTYTNNNWEWGVSLIETYDGGFVIGTSNQKLKMIKTDNLGNCEGC